MTTDVERATALRLSRAVGVPAFLEVPRDAPEEFITVEQTGGAGGRFARDVELSAQSWAGTRRRAYEIARAVEDAAESVEEEACVFRCVPAGTYRFPDPDTRRERYQTNLEMTICE